MTLSPVANETKDQPNWRRTNWVRGGQLQVSSQSVQHRICESWWDISMFVLLLYDHFLSVLLLASVFLARHIGEWTLLLKESDMLQLSADCLCYVWRGEPETAEAVWPPGWVNGSLPFAARINITQRCLITMPNASRWRPTVAAPIKIMSLCWNKWLRLPVKPERGERWREDGVFLLSPRGQ